MKEILQKANELAQMIQESKEYKRAQETELLQQQDQNAQNMIESYNERRREAAIKMQYNELSDEEMTALRSEINDAFDQLMESKVIRDFVEAQKDYESLNQQVLAIITGENGGCGSSGGCSSCSGCH